MDPMIPFVAGLVAAGLHRAASEGILLTLDPAVVPEMRADHVELVVPLRSGKQIRIMVMMDEEGEPE